MWTAFPSADYYGHSVALGLAACRRSRVRSNRTSERDVGPSFNPLNSLVGRRPMGGKFKRRNSCRSIPSASPIHAVAMDVRFHPWSLRFKQSSLDLITRALQDDRSGMFARLPLFDHALVPKGFRHPVRSMAQKHLSQLLLPAAGIRSAAFTAHSCPAHGSSLRSGGKRSPAARSIRFWFRLTGSFRHPAFGLFSLRRLTS